MDFCTLCSKTLPALHPDVHLCVEDFRAAFGMVELCRVCCTSAPSLRFLPVGHVSGHRFATGLCIHEAHFKTFYVLLMQCYRNSICDHMAFPMLLSLLGICNEHLVDDFTCDHLTYGLLLSLASVNLAEDAVAGRAMFLQHVRAPATGAEGGTLSDVLINGETIGFPFSMHRVPRGQDTSVIRKGPIAVLHTVEGRINAGLEQETTVPAGGALICFPPELVSGKRLMVPLFPSARAPALPSARDPSLPAASSRVPCAADVRHASSMSRAITPGTPFFVCLCLVGIVSEWIFIALFISHRSSSKCPGHREHRGTQQAAQSHYSRPEQ